LTYEGTCDGDTVTWCEGGAIESQDCKNYGDDYQCAWIENQETYWCTNKCQAACGGKECGSDGCDGTCGVCPGDEICNDGGLCIAPGGGGDCGDISWEGICEGNTLKYCSLLDQSLVTFNCGTLGQKCGWDADASYNSCVASTDGCTPNCLLDDGSPKSCGDDGCGNLCGVCEADFFCDAGTCSAGAGACGDITVTGECNGDTLVYCAGGALYDQDCGAQNMTCGFDESGPDGGWFDCLESTEPAPACGPVPEQGVCADNILTYCKSGNVETLSCTDAGLQCLYSPVANGGTGGYDCYDDPGCAATCPENQRCQFDGTCGCDGVTVEGHCEGTMLVWCNGEGLVQSDCGATGCGLSNGFATCL